MPWALVDRGIRIPSDPLLRINQITTIKCWSHRISFCISEVHKKLIYASPRACHQQSLAWDSVVRSSQAHDLIVSTGLRAVYGEILRHMSSTLTKQAKRRVKRLNTILSYWARIPISLAPFQSPWPKTSQQKSRSPTQHVRTVSLSCFFLYFLFDSKKGRTSRGP